MIYGQVRWKIMENIVFSINRALSQIGSCFLFALSFAFLLEGVADLVVWFRKQRQRNTVSMNPTKPTTVFQAKEVAIFINGKEVKVVPGSLVISTSGGTPPAARSLSIGFEISTLKAMAKAASTPKTYSSYAARLAVPTVPAQWIPSTRKRKKLRRRLTPQFL